MPTTQIMYAVVRPDGYGKKQYIRVPFVSALISEPDVPQRYFVLREDEPLPVMPRRRRYDEDDDS